MGRRRLAVVAAALVAVVGCRAEPPPELPPSILLITLDTTRLDALGAPGITPNLDRFATGACVFREARTVCPLTLPAHASLFTGLYPPRHGVRLNGPNVLPPDATTLAERLQAAGYQTAAFVASLALDRSFGIAQGFEVWSQPGEESSAHVGVGAERTAGEVIAALDTWWPERDPERPLFLWVHFFDPHAPYAPPAAFLEQAGGDSYLGEVAAMDAAVGELLDRVRGGGLFDSSVIAIVADHGESRGEHGEDTHGLTCYDATLRIPLMIRWPDGTRAGETSDEIVGIADLNPTLLRAAHVTPESGLDGRDLLAANLEGVYFECYEGWRLFDWSPLAGWVDRSGKYIHGSQPKWFDLTADPNEKHGSIAGLDTAGYRAKIARVAERASAVSATQAAEDAERTSLALEALGYLGGGLRETPFPHPLEPGERPDPDERLELYREFIVADSLVRGGFFSEAKPKLETVLAVNPRHTRALERLGEVYQAAGDHSAAIEVFVRRAELQPAQSAVHRALARSYRALGDRAEANRHAKRALELAAGAYERQGRSQDAAELRELLERAPGD